MPMKNRSRPWGGRHSGFANVPSAFAALVLCYAPLIGQNQGAHAPGKDEPIRPIEISQRISALKHDLARGDSRALDFFWKEVGQTGTPLVEPLRERPGEVIVTFLWRGGAQTQNIALQAPLANSPGMPTLALMRLPGTDVRYRCWRIRDDLRFTYRFVVDAEPGENPQNFIELDPLNSQRMELSLDEHARTKIEYSVASMPRAPDESSIIRHANVPAGALVRHSFESLILGNERSIWTYTPPGYDEKTEHGYPLLVLFDGFSYQNWIPAPVILDNLIDSGQIQPMIAVLIGNASDARNSELGSHSRLVEFLSKEMIPWVHQHWNVTQDPEKSIIRRIQFWWAGGGLCSTKAPRSFRQLTFEIGSVLARQ